VNDPAFLDTGHPTDPKIVRPPDWIFEKYDGLRALAQIENRLCRLISRRDNIYKRFTDLAKGDPR
jgi:ATP-dependent DNA ligase